GEIRKIGLDKLDFMKRKACSFCMDYSAELADISFGGIGANEGWTTVITRTPLGRAILADAKGKTLEISSGKDGLEDSSSKTIEKIENKSLKKQKLAKENRKKIK
ncbi:MAG: coenzyme F420 hydrogenase, partial [Desulfobacula sp.]|nr:coenzyme F420 hydrogenase [Desulfobacula sp.]